MISSKQNKAIELKLRLCTEDDVAIFFKQQSDVISQRMAAFVGEEKDDITQFTKKWTKILSDDSMEKRTIVVDGRIVGYLASFYRAGQPEVCYWLGKEFWGRGIATHALKCFLSEFHLRPLFARAALANIGSIRVLEKCGFVCTGRGKYFALAHGHEVDEVVMQLTAIDGLPP